MSENTVVHIGENSPEQVAYKLLQDIMRVEGKTSFHGESETATREYILDTFAECRKAAIGFRKIS